MALTRIEFETMELLQRACSSYVKNTSKIDWEQRRYEIAKDVLCALIDDTTIVSSEVCQMAVIKADQLVDELKKHA